jgi:hypothetical protein
LEYIEFNLHRKTRNREWKKKKHLEKMVRLYVSYGGEEQCSFKMDGRVSLERVRSRLADELPLLDMESVLLRYRNEASETRGQVPHYYAIHSDQDWQEAVDLGRGVVHVALFDKLSLSDSEPPTPESAQPLNLCTRSVHAGFSSQLVEAYNDVESENAKGQEEKEKEKDQDGGDSDDASGEASSSSSLARSSPSIDAIFSAEWTESLRKKQVKKDKAIASALGALVECQRRQTDNQEALAREQRQFNETLAALLAARNSEPVAESAAPRDLDDRVAELQAECADREARNVDLRQTLAAAEASWAKSDARAAQFASANDSLQQALDSAAHGAKDETQQLVAQRDDLIASVNDLNEQVRESAVLAETLQAKLTASSSQLQASQEQLVSLSSERDALASQVGTLTKPFADEAQRLQEETARLQSENVALTDQLQTSKARVTDVERKELQSQAELMNLHDAFEDLQKRQQNDEERRRAAENENEKEKEKERRRQQQEEDERQQQEDEERRRRQEEERQKLEQPSQELTPFEQLLKQLNDMGFTDLKANVGALVKHKCDLQAAILELSSS